MNTLPATQEELEELRIFVAREMRARERAQNAYKPHVAKAKRAADIASRIKLAEPVTIDDAMVERARYAFTTSLGITTQDDWRAALTAALTPTSSTEEG